MKLISIWRHPIKAIGREPLSFADLRVGEVLSFDRRWAVTHDRTREAGPGWAKKANFLRGVSGPQLMAVEASLDDFSGRIRLTHPDRPPLEVSPTDHAEAIVEWLDPLWPEDLPRPTDVSECATGFTDVPDPWISIASVADHKMVEQKLGSSLSIHRWRANLWVEGLAPWETLDLPGKGLRIGVTVLEVAQPITRCKATMANPETGLRDADTLGALREFGHQEFGVYARVIEGGEISPGDPVEVH